jgi:hypothetical protein
VKSFDSITSITDLFIWAESQWPGFYSWLIKDPAFSKEDDKDLDNSIMDDSSGRWGGFCAKIAEIAENYPVTEEEVELLLLGAARGGKNGR